MVKQSRSTYCSILMAASVEIFRRRQAKPDPKPHCRSLRFLMELSVEIAPATKLAIELEVCSTAPALAYCKRTKHDRHR